LALHANARLSFAGFSTIAPRYPALELCVAFSGIDGSFVDDCETIRERPPGDVDIVTFAYRPVVQNWLQFVQQNLRLFDFSQTKALFLCDAYYVDLQNPPHLIVHDTTYFNGLFSHQRDSKLWKGMLALDLSSDDSAAQQFL